MDGVEYRAPTVLIMIRSRILDYFLSYIFISQRSYFSIQSIATTTSSKEGSANSLTWWAALISRKFLVGLCILSFGKVSDDLALPASKQTCFPTPRTKTLSRRRVLGNHQESSQSEKKIRSRNLRNCLLLTYSTLYCNNPWFSEIKSVKCEAGEHKRTN